jgi:hypothetical protein
VAVRNIAQAGTRSFGGLAILAAILGLALLSAAPAVALAPSETAIGLSLQRVATGKEALAIRGASVESETAQFSAVATLSQIPCPGAYRYELQSENQETGALSSYSALLTLAPFAVDQPTPCGAVPQARRGALRISTTGDEETIDFRGQRGSSSGNFFGSLTIGTQPVCDQAYTLSANVDLRGWDRGVRYRLRVASWRSEAQGRELERHDCG